MQARLLISVLVAMIVTFLGLIYAPQPERIHFSNSRYSVTPLGMAFASENEPGGSLALAEPIPLGTPEPTPTPTEHTAITTNLSHAWSTNTTF